jgi:hypothetical protein
MCRELALVRGDVPHRVPIETSSCRRVQHHDLFAKRKRLALPLLQHSDQPFATYLIITYPATKPDARVDQERVECPRLPLTFNIH